MGAKKKCEEAYNTAMAIAGSVDLKNIELKMMWELFNTFIIPTMTYGWEHIIPKKTLGPGENEIHE